VKLVLRSLTKSPGFTAIAIVTLALGLGVNAAAFAFVRDMLLHARVEQSRHHLVALYTKSSDSKQDFRRFSYDEFTSARSSREIFSDVTAYSLGWAAVGRDNDVKRSLVTFVPENYFAAFGVQPLAGRFFTAKEAAPGANVPVVIADHTFWQRMGGRADFIGSEIRINRHAFTVIGIAPQGFGSVNVSLGPEVWLPFGMEQSLFGTDLRAPHTYDLYLIGNLRPGLSLANARGRAPALAGRLNELHAGEEPHTLVLARPGLFDLGNIRPSEEGYVTLFATLTLGLAAAVLLVACLNLANLLLARGAERRKEIAIRLSLGASRIRIVRQLLAEGLALAAAGCGGALLLSVWSRDLLMEWAKSAFAASPFTLTIQPAIDPLLLITLAVLSGVATILFSLVPALRSSRVDLVADLKRQPGLASHSGHWNRFFSLRHTLLMGQLALSLMLLFSAGLFVRGARAASKLSPGFSTERQIVAGVDFDLTGLASAEITRHQQALLEKARTLPGVASAALASAVPFNFELPFVPVRATGRPAVDQGRPAAKLYAGSTAVTRGYFGTLGISLLRGRDFTEAESREPNTRAVAIVDESLASTLFPHEDALGRHLDLGGAPSREVEIVGIVHSPRDQVWEQTAPRRIYRPLAQMPEARISLHLQLEPGLQLNVELDRMRRELRAIAEPIALLLSVRPLAGYLDKNINVLLVKLAASAFSGFALVAIVLAVVGIYGLKAYAVAQRTREIGIRLALGAQVSDIVALILRQGAAQVAVAAVAGIALSLLAGHALSKMLYRVAAFDPLLLAGATVMLVVVALFASWLPTRRATKVDPMVALRAE
jgi:predicted permease